MRRIFALLENINEAIVGCLKSRLKAAGMKLKIPNFDRRLDISIDLAGTRMHKLPRASGDKHVAAFNGAG